MPTTLDQILNYLVPIVAILFFIWVLYRAFKEPIDKLIEYIKEKREEKKDNEKEKKEIDWGYSISYDN